MINTENLLGDEAPPASAYKPVIYFARAFGLELDYPVFAIGAGHHNAKKQNGIQSLRTTNVVKVHENGNFETTNSRYVQVKELSVPTQELGLEVLRFGDVFDVELPKKDAGYEEVQRATVLVPNIKDDEQNPTSEALVYLSKTKGTLIIPWFYLAMGTKVEDGLVEEIEDK